MEKSLTMSLPKKLYPENEACSYAEIFADIFDRYYNRVYKYMRYRLDSVEEAEDLSSQVFEQVMQKINTYKPDRAPFEVWLFAIAQNTVNAYYRRRKRWIWSPLESVRNMPSERPTPEAATVHNENQKQLLAALSSLDERERNIIAMKFAGGLKNREIAKLMGLSESNTGVILYRALHQLRTILKEGE